MTSLGGTVGQTDKPCPVCEGVGQFAFTKYGYAIHACQTCGHRFLGKQASPNHLSQVYDDQYFSGGGAGYPDYLAQGDMLRDHGRRYARLLRSHVSTGSMLDVGAAAGFVLQGFTDEGWNGSGIEPNVAMAEHGRAQLGLEIQTGPLETVVLNDPVDLVSMIQVLPHLYDLEAGLASAARVTKPKGHWLIETWNRESLTARVFGQHWHEYSPPSVMRWFAPDDLARLLACYGFEEIARGRPKKRIRSGHAKSLLRYKLRDMGAVGRLMGASLGIIPDSLTIPYPSEDLFWGLYRKRSA